MLLIKLYIYNSDGPTKLKQLWNIRDFDTYDKIVCQITFI